MIDTQQIAYEYVERRFPYASMSEREKIVNDWVGKITQARGIASDFEKRVGLLKGLHVLDAGSGPGGISIAFAERGANVDGVDIEAELVAIARTAADTAGSSAKFVLYDGVTLPFADASFDVALSISVIEHVDQPVRYLSEILRVLKPEGILYLAFPNKLYPKETHTGLLGLSYLPFSFARLYVRLMRRNPLEANGLHFYSYWDMLRFIRVSATPERKWEIIEESGNTTNPLKRIVKCLLRACGIPHQALLPHVMIVFRASK